MPTELERWPRARGPESAFPWVPSSPRAAVENLCHGLDEQQRLELFPRLFRILPGRIVAKRAERLKGITERVARGIDELRHLSENSPEDGRWAVPLDSPQGRLELAAAVLLNQAFYALYAAGLEAHENASRIMNARPRAESADALVRGVLDLGWMNGQVLALAAIALEFEKPVRCTIGGPGDQRATRAAWERRRQAWDARLRRARAAPRNPRRSPVRVVA